METEAHGTDMDIEMPIFWSMPNDITDVCKLPNEKGVYSIFDNRDDRSLLRIGSASNLRKRILQYDQSIFNEFQDIMVAFSLVDMSFKNKIFQFLSLHYPEFAEKDKDWMEYRMEYGLLEEYKIKWGQIPPANFQSGSKRIYMRHIKLVEYGSIATLDMKPANHFHSSVLMKFCQGKKQRGK